MANLKLEILSAAKRVERVAVPELGGMAVYLRPMTGAEADVYQAALEKASASNTSVGLSLLLLSLTICDETGKRQFENTDELNAVDSVAITRLTHRALELNGLTKEAREALEKKV